VRGKFIDLFNACEALKNELIDIGFLENLWEIDNIIAREEKLKSEVEDYIEKKHI